MGKDYFFTTEVESNEPEPLRFEIVLLLITAGVAIGFFAVAATYAVYLGL